MSLSNAERRDYHRIEFQSGIEIRRLEDELLEDRVVLRSRIKAELRMLRWLQLDNQYAFVRDSAQRNQPALAPLIRLVDAKLNFLAGELFSNEPVAESVQRIEMSATGLSFRWPEPLPAGSLWLIHINPVGADAPLSMPAVIQRSDSSSERDPERIAAEFFALSEDETDALASWIVGRQAKSLSRQKSRETD